MAKTERLGTKTGQEIGVAKTERLGTKIIFETGVAKTERLGTKTRQEIGVAKTERLGTKTRQEIRTLESNDSPEIPDRRLISDIPGLHFYSTVPNSGGSSTPVVDDEVLLNVLRCQLTY